MRVKDQLKDEIVIQLEGTSILTLDFSDSPEEFERKSKLHEKTNAPLGVVVLFVNGKPTATLQAEQAEQAEQGGARQPATAVDSKLWRAARKLNLNRRGAPG